MANSDTHRELHDLFNGRDFDGLVKRFTEDFRFTDHARGIELQGGEAFKGWLTEWTGAMSNARVTDARYLDAGDTSVALFTGRGTHDGQLGPLPASGAELAFPLCEVLRYDADGNVTGGEMYYDQTGVAAQVAAVTTARARQPGEGDAFWMLGGLYEVLLSSDDTGGAATVMQMTVPVGMGPPLHIHPGPEIVQVLEGTLTSTLGDRTVEAGPGAVVYIPAGTPERFEPRTDVKLLITYLPGGIERFFAEAGERASRREVPPAPTAPPDVERLTAIGAKYGLQILPPPGG